MCFGKGGERVRLGGGKASRRRGGTTSAIRRRWLMERWEMAQLGRVGRVVGQMRCTVNYDFHNYFSMEKGGVA
jgi:hypothetical protein